MHLREQLRRLRLDAELLGPSEWVEALQTTHLREGIEPDPVSRWLIITRAAVIPMTFFSAAIGGLLAVPE